MTAQCWWYMLYKGTVAYIAFKKGIVPDRSYHPIFVFWGGGREKHYEYKTTFPTETRNVLFTILYTRHWNFHTCI